VIGGVSDTADNKTGDFIVENLGEFKSIFENVLARVSGVQMELL
jgi:hypothetical protein